MRSSCVVSSLFLLSTAQALNVPRQSSNSSGYAVKTPPLTTPWTYKVGTDPWPEYPRPIRQRSEWQSLNGIWGHQKVHGNSSLSNPPAAADLQPVLVPSCLESGLSGVMGVNMTYNWYSTSFTVPSSWSGNVILNFGAVDYEATVFVNGQQAAFHRGGYYAFEVDITSYLNGGMNELLVFAFDPTDLPPYLIPIGKQTRNPSHIFYTPCSGIWQSVWIESAPANYITDMNLNADMNGMVSGMIETSQGGSMSAQISIMPRGGNGAATTQQVSANQQFSFNVDSPSLWSPDSPNLYDITVKMGQDTIKSYTGFRTVSKGMVNGIMRPLLNGEFIYFFGTLDQGFWPDGIYVPPNREAMVYDLKVLKQLGFNGLRKHIKVENDLFYQACDEMGLLLIQDQPSLPAFQLLPDPAQQMEFQRELELLVKQHRNYPSIMTWVIYNEGWGQLTYPTYPEFGLTDIVRQLDPTRLIDSTTGWYFHGAGDYLDNHHYSSPQCGTPYYSIPSSPYPPNADKIGFQGEFGGIGNNVSIEHLWNVQEAILAINQTYELDATVAVWRERTHEVLGQLLQQTQEYACSGAVYTQTTDVEGEVNGLLTYDRRVLRPDPQSWRKDLMALYAAAAARGNSSMDMMT